jgi:hypothetical protein
MDPTTCYMTILEATREHDWARAREYALILKGWLESGGFYPKGYEVNEIRDTLERILRPACRPDSLQFPFNSIQCFHCDAGKDIDDLEDAIDLGWIKIEPEMELANYSHIGLCPECRRIEEDDRD